MKRTAFDLYHPAVALAYFVFLLVMDMAAMQPVYLLISFIAALAYNVMLRGVRLAARTFLWLALLIVVVALVNFAFSATGTTEIARIGSHAFYLESLVYGISMALMLASVILTFSNAAQVLTSDKIMMLLGNVLPTVSLMLCMAARLVPQFVRQGSDIRSARQACTAHVRADKNPSQQKNKQQSDGRLRTGAREISVLMGWSMENSLDTADSMRARGWGATRHRKPYNRYRFRFDDGIALAFLLVLMVSSSIAAYTACSQFQFYPQMTGFAPWWSYIAYAVYALLPLLAQGWELIRWRR